MSLGCSRCGACCDPVFIDEAVVDRWAAWLDYWRAGGEKDARVRDERGRFSTERPDPTLRFIAAHMTEVARHDGVVEFACDFYNRATRSCTDYDQRPPMCSNCPWYGQEPDEDHAQRLPAPCSFALDVAPALRRDDARPLIPLTVLGRS